MKKWLLLSAVLLTMLLLGLYMSRGLNVRAQIDDPYVYVQSHCQRFPRYQSYEWIYAHLTDDDQDLVDLEFIRLLELADFSSLTEEEKQQALTSIKEDLLEFIKEEGFVVGRRR